MCKLYITLAHIPLCCISEGEVIIGEATLRKIRWRHEIRRGMRGVPLAFKESLLQEEIVLFLPSLSLFKRKTFQYITNY